MRSASKSLLCLWARLRFYMLQAIFCRSAKHYNSNMRRALTIALHKMRLYVSQPAIAGTRPRAVPIAKMSSQLALATNPAIVHALPACPACRRRGRLHKANF